MSERQIYAFMFAVFVSGSGLDGFYSILAGVGFTVLPGWGGFCFPFAVCGVRVCAGGPPVCQVTVLLGALWLFKMCPVFLSDKSGLRFCGGVSVARMLVFSRFQPCRFPFPASRLHFVRRT